MIRLFRRAPRAAALALAAVAAAALTAADARAEGEIFPGSEDRGASLLGVQTGMTIGAARDAVDTLTWIYEPRFMVDFSADCAERDGETLFCLLVFEREKRVARDTVEGIVVFSPEFATPKGVRVGMRISEVERRWGAATFAFSYANEGREFVSFAEGPRRISARAISESLGGAESRGFHIGLYAAETADQEFQETNVYRSDAEVGTLWLN